MGCLDVSVLWRAALLFRYVSGDPINAFDPTGMTTCGDLPVSSGFTVSSYLCGGGNAGLLTRLVWHEGGTVRANQNDPDVLFAAQVVIGQAALNRLAIANGQVAVLGADGRLYWGAGGYFSGSFFLPASILVMAAMESVLVG